MHSPRHRERGRASRILLVLFLIFVLLAVGSIGFYVWATGASGPQRPVPVEIAQGSDPGDVANLLADAEVIRSPFMFRVMVRLRGLAPSILAGSYEFSTNLPLSEALDVLAAGPIPEKTVSTTIPEGLRVEEVAGAVAEDLGLPQRAVLEEATSGEWSLPPFLPAGTSTVEGFLFPKTYEFPEEGLSPEAVVGRLLQQFRTEARTLRWGSLGELGISRYEAVIIASLVEREARIPEDRPKVAAVIYNRLELGMPLQIDATVQYALPQHKDSLTYEDYEYESPYNTYLIPGLPPTPIASPGLASLEAALAPADASYLYYVVIDESGRHAFTDSYDEFLRLKEEAQSGG